MPSEEERRYSADEVRERLRSGLAEWRVEDGWLRRDFRTDGWPTTLMLVNQIGYLAEAAFHHPDLEVGWNRVAIRLQTHDAGGITDRDLELARKLEEVVLWRPPPGGSLEGTPNPWVRGERGPG